MKAYEFTVIVDCLTIDDHEHTDRICSPAFDLLVVQRDGVTSVAAAIDAPDEDEALRTVISFLEWGVATPLRIDEDFVNTAEISERFEVNREMVRLWAKAPEISSRSTTQLALDRKSGNGLTSTRGQQRSEATSPIWRPR